jgi:hypothetical protein
VPFTLVIIGLYPAMRAARLPPIAAMHHEEHTNDKASERRAERLPGVAAMLSRRNRV